MGCIEIYAQAARFIHYNMFNRNMGCIEIRNVRPNQQRRAGLIETWDVLKFVKVINASNKPDRFNRNMGCIEIGIKQNTAVCAKQFNRNMGCIEMGIKSRPAVHDRLFNRNMGCIEMREAQEGTVWVL